jgi:Sulfotransferase family
MLDGKTTEAEMNRKRPNFFIVGAPRCGTTALYSYLRQHPDVFLPEYKEPHFFNIDMNSGGAIRDEAEYLALFAEAKDQTRIGEASVYYLSSEAAPERIRSFCPQAKIIMMLRNPVDAVDALHAHQVAAWIEEVWDLEQALALEEKRKGGKHIPAWMDDPHKLFYRQTVDFPAQLRRYSQVFGWENLHVIIFDDFKRDTAAAFRQTCTFLGVTPDIELEFPVVWSNPSFRSQALARFVRRPPGPLRRLGRMIMPGRARTKIVNALNSWNSVRAPRQPMSPDLRNRLTAEFAPQVNELSDLLGRDLSNWTRIKDRSSFTAA